MVHLICYGAALALNLGWLLLGDHLSLWTQVAVPVFSVLIAGAGVVLRLRELPRGAARRRYLRGALWVFLVYYLAILSVLLFFGGLFHMDRGWGGSINLEPFHTIRNYIRYYRNTGSHVSIFNLLGNVVIMVPMGVLLPALFRPLRRFWLTIPLLAVIPTAVEYLQWRTATGAADVDDAILNFIGGVLGYVFVRTCQMLHAHWEKKQAQ